MDNFMPNASPRVTVLMPVYNVELYVKEAIESILNQTFSDFELLIINDGSTDNTELEVLRFEDNRIVYVKNEQNIGLANTLNKGMLLARGEYIARMDGDDISLPSRLQVQVDFLDLNPDISLCSTALELFGASGGVLVGKSDSEQIKVDLIFSSAIGHASSLFRREVFVNNGYFFNQDFFPAEDYELWTRAVFHCKLTNLPKPLYLYRMHETQVTKVDDRAASKCKEIQMNYLRNTLAGLSEETVRMFVENFLNKPKSGNPYMIRQCKPMFQAIRKENLKSGFFDKSILDHVLKRVYQNRMYGALEKLSLSEIIQNPLLLLDLRIEQLRNIVFKH